MKPAGRVLVSFACFQLTTESAADGFCHSLEAIDAGSVGFFCSNQECGAGEVATVGQRVYVARILLHERGGSWILELDPLFESVICRPMDLSKSMKTG